MLFTNPIGTLFAYLILGLTTSINIHDGIREIIHEICVNL